MKSYREATNWARDQVEGKIVDGKLNFPECTFADAIVEFSAGIEFVQPESANSFYNVSEALAGRLWLLAGRDHEFFDLCSKICSKNLLADVPLPKCLRIFAAQVLDGELKRPTPPNRSRDRNWLEQMFLWSRIEVLAWKFGLDRTRNDEPPTPRSACDAIANALATCGRKTTYSEMKRIIVDKRKKRLRDEFRACMRIGKMKDIRGLNPDATAEARAREVMEEILRILPKGREKSPNLS